AGVTLDVVDGEFLVLLGPSGCGKTTTLRMIAGLVEPSGGSARIGGADVTHLPPWRRNTSMVFQSYALFPHMTVAENVAFGLEMRKLARAEIEARAREALRLVRLDGFAARLPRELSGGQQQRVALARALAIRPDVLRRDGAPGAAALVLRPERLHLGGGNLDNRLPGKVEFVSYLGAVLELHVRLSPADRVLVQLPNRGEAAPAVGDEIELGWQRDAGMVFAEQRN